MKFTLYTSILLLAVLLFGTSCNDDVPTIDNNPPIDSLTNIENTYGFEIMSKIKGIWDGPVTSSTPIGDFPQWIVDFRPISASQISSKNELDTINDIHMSFFVAKYNGEYRVCFRNGGGFAGAQRVSYFLADSISKTATEDFCRFTEIIQGTPRAYTDILFKADSVIMTSYTNKFNTQSTATIHMQWRAGLKDTTSAQTAVTAFNFPQKVLAKDFTTTFNGHTEAVYYSLASDPYAENQQPYLGQTTINYSFTGGFTPDPSKKVLLMISAQPLISGFTIDFNNFKFRSRYVILNADDYSYEFNYMHPGTYYVYALYDNDGNLNFNSGDRTSTANTTFTLTDQGTVSASASINFTIP